MTTLMIVLVGYTTVYWSYRLSVTKGRRRRVKRGVWDFGMTKMRRDFEEELRELTNDWGSWGNLRGELKWD